MAFHYRRSKSTKPTPPAEVPSTSRVVGIDVEVEAAGGPQSVSADPAGPRLPPLPQRENPLPGASPVQKALLVLPQWGTPADRQTCLILR